MTETYTLEEAKLELVKRECMMNGHQWDVIELQMESIPVAIICGRCGLRYSVEGQANEEDSYARR